MASLSAAQSKSNAVRALAARMYAGHCWRDGPNGPRKLDERFTEIHLSAHVSGSETYGLCPIAPGESATRVALLDLDAHKGETPWPEMRRVADLIRTALELDGYKPVLFRSSGGSGIHIY